MPIVPGIARRASIDWVDAALAHTPHMATDGPVFLDAPLDLTGRSPAIALCHSDAVAGLPLTWRLGSGPEDAYSWTVTSDGVDRPSMFATGEPVQIALPLVDADVVGTPDRSAITWWDVSVEGGVGVEVTGIGSVPDPEEFPLGLVSLTFDDSYGSQFDIAFKAMSEHGLVGTLVPIIGRFDGPGYLTSEQVQAMADGGWEISAHALSDATHNLALHRMSAEERAAEMAGIAEWNNSRGYEAATYSYPGGYYDAESAGHTLDFYAGSRSAYGEFHETWPPTQPDRIRAVVIKTDTHPDIEAYRAEIAAAREHKAWVVLVFHQLGEDPQGDPWVADAGLFRQFCDELVASEVPVLTMAQALLR